MAKEITGKSLLGQVYLQVTNYFINEEMSTIIFGNFFPNLCPRGSRGIWICWFEGLLNLAVADEQRREDGTNLRRSRNSLGLSRRRPH